jgi:hypothetical protein
MTQDEIIEIYLQVSKELCNNTEWCWAGVGEPLQMFAKLAVAKEREACAKVCDSFYLSWIDIQGRYEFMGEGASECAGAIRARGQA